MKVNMDGVESWKSGGGILAPGKHAVVVADADEGVSSGGHPEIKLTLESIDPQFAGAGIRDWIVVTAKSVGRVRQLLEAAGVEIPSGEFEFPAIKLIDKRMLVYVKEKTIERGEKAGQKTTEVASYAPLDESDIPADTRGLAPVAGNGSADDQADLPF